MVDRPVAVRISAINGDFNRAMDESARKTDSLAASLASADGRLAMIVQTGLAVAPALAPLATVAIPAVVGLTTQMGFLALAGGATIFALNGVGDALDALNKFHLDPTAENFDKVSDTMDSLGLTAQEFVLLLDSLRPEIERFRAIASDALLPGVESGIRELITLLPQARQILGTVAETVGEIAADIGRGFTGESWIRFFEYLDNQARPILTETTQTIGNLATGVAELVMSFDPLTQDWSTGLLQFSEVFRDWATGLSETGGFQEFIEYVQTRGPQVLDTLQALGSMLLQIFEALLPVGDVVLPMLEALANGIGALANSSAGPVILGLAAAIGILGRSLALMETVGLRGAGTGFIATGVRNIRDEVAKATPTLAQAGTYFNRLGQSTQYATVETIKAREAMRGFFRTIAPGVGVVGGLALMQSGLTEKAGLSNTALLGLTGTIAGPYGAAAGAAIGLTLDLASSNDEVVEAVKRGQDAMSRPFDVGTQLAGLAEMRAQVEAFQQDVARGASPVGGSWDIFESVSNKFKAASNFFTHTTEENAAAVETAELQFDQMTEAVGRLSAAFGEPIDTTNLIEVSQAVERLRPAFINAGIDFDGLMQKISDPDPVKRGLGAMELAAAQVALIVSADTASSIQGRAAAVGEAMADLEVNVEGTATAADALKATLDSLFSPLLNQSAATDAWTVALRDLRSKLAETNGEVLNNSEAALANRSVVRDTIQTLLDKVAVDAKAGVSGDKLMDTLIQGRQGLIDQGVAGGVARDSMRELINTLGLMPKTIETMIVTNGDLSAKQKIEALGRLYRITPKDITTLINQPNMPAAQSQIDELRRKYDLTPREVRTLIRLLGAREANAGIDSVRGNANDLDGKVIDIYQVLHIQRPRVPTGVLAPQAEGSVTDYYASGGVRESHVAQIAPAGAWRVWAEPETGGEAYIPLAESKRDRSLDIWREAGRRLGAEFIELASGGVVGSPATSSGGDSGLGRALTGLSREVRRLGDRVEIGAARGSSRGAAAGMAAADTAVANRLWLTGLGAG